MKSWVLGLGSNHARRLDFLRRAVRELGGDPDIRLVSISAIYESQAMLPPGAPSSWDQPFLNLAVQAQSSLDPRELLSRTKAIEKKLGRKLRERWAPREIDIDLLAWEGGPLQTEELKLPHEGLLERPFALLPLVDVCPGWPIPDEARAKNKSWRHGKAPFSTQRAPIPWTELVGIVNLTPDSFSDGGKVDSAEKAVARAIALAEEGAAVIDLGAESTRPGATPLSWDEDWARLGPVLERISARPRALAAVKISVDTRHPECATRALDLGADWINDVSGGDSPEMIRALSRAQADYVFMHHLGVPANPAVTLDPGNDPVLQLRKWTEGKLRDFEEVGIPRHRLIFDPGVGFGKDPSQSHYLLQHARALRQSGVRTLVGHSRKSFLSRLNPLPPRERDLETAALSLFLTTQGVDYLRVHDVGMHARLLGASALFESRIEIS